MKNKDQNNTTYNGTEGDKQTHNTSIDTPHILTDKIHHVFGKASEFKLTDEERAKGSNEFKALMEKGLPSPYSQFVLRHKKRITNICLVACFILIFTTGTVSASNTSLPGDFLYPIKTKISEPLEEILAIGPKAKAEVAVKHAIERVKEATELSVVGKISQKNQDAINAEIARESNTARESIVRLKAEGHIKSAQDISIGFKNSVNVYQKNLESVSKFNKKSVQEESINKVLNTINIEIQKIDADEDKDESESVRGRENVQKDKNRGYMNSKIDKNHQEDFIRVKQNLLNYTQQNKAGSSTTTATTTPDTISTTTITQKVEATTSASTNSTDTPTTAGSVQISTPTVTIPTPSIPAPTTPTVPTIVPTTPVVVPTVQINLR